MTNAGTPEHHTVRYLHIYKTNTLINLNLNENINIIYE